ncbi:MAG TPA: terminase family protein [Armatimonadota bacterium]|jgi:phage FluMu gp28-like protein
MEHQFDWTADAVMAAAVRGSGHTLTDYQRAYLSDPSSLRAVLKARQTGFSWLFALEALGEAIANGRFSIFVSLNREEAAEKIIYARELYDGLPAEMKKPLARWGAFELRFEGGGRLLSFPCRAPRGRAGASLYLDEMAFYPHSDRVYGGALPVITHGGRVTVASTPCGDRGMFWRLLMDPEISYRYSQHRVPWWRSPWLCRDVEGASAVPEMETEARVGLYGTPMTELLRGALDLETFQQEYELRFVDCSEAYIPWEEIESNVRDMGLAARWSDLRGRPGRLYAGVDVGRVVHATEIVVLRETVRGFEVAAMKTMIREPFEEQENAVMDCLRVSDVARMAVDGTGIGREFGERLHRLAPLRFESVQFTLQSKDHMARTLRRMLQEGRLTLPRDRSLMDQLHVVRREATDGGRIRYVAPVAGHSHADKFWALALALHAAVGTRALVQARAVW